MEKHIHRLKRKHRGYPLKNPINFPNSTATQKPPLATILLTMQRMLSKKQRKNTFFQTTKKIGR